jgi:hypothetical protein
MQHALKYLSSQLDVSILTSIQQMSHQPHYRNWDVLPGFHHYNFTCDRKSYCKYHLHGIQDCPLTCYYDPVSKTRGIFMISHRARYYYSKKRLVKIMVYE